MLFYISLRKNHRKISDLRIIREYPDTALVQESYWRFRFMLKKKFLIDISYY